MVIKPTNPLLNQGNSLMNGLVFDTNLSEGAGLKAFDMVGKVEGALAGPPNWRDGLYGKELLFNAASNNRVSYLTNSLQNGLGLVSVEMLIYLNGAGEGGSGVFLYKGGSTGRFRFSYASSTFGRTDVWSVAVLYNSSTSFWVSNSNSLPVGKYYHLIYTHDLSNPSIQPTLYINNVLQSNGGSAGSGTIISDSGTSTYLGSNFSQGSDFDGRIVYARMWNRLITPTEARLLYVDPYRIYKRPATIQTIAQVSSSGLASLFGDEGFVS